MIAVYAVEPAETVTTLATTIFSIPMTTAIPIRAVFADVLRATILSTIRMIMDWVVFPPVTSAGITVGVYGSGTILTLLPTATQPPIGPLTAGLFRATTTCFNRVSMARLAPAVVGVLALAFRLGFQSVSVAGNRCVEAVPAAGKLNLDVLVLRA